MDGDAGRGEEVSEGKRMNANSVASSEGNIVKGLEEIKRGRRSTDWQETGDNRSKTGAPRDEEDC